MRNVATLVCATVSSNAHQPGIAWVTRGHTRGKQDRLKISVDLQDEAITP